MITYRKPPSLKDMLVKARLTQPRQKTNKECKRPKTCKYCTKMSQLGRIKNSYNNKTYNTITKGTCQSNNLVYCIECNWCHIKYVGQTKNRIIDRFQGHLFDIKNNLNTTVARHFGSHNDRTDPNMTIHILEYIRLPKDLPRSSSLRDNRELVWIHRLNNSQWPKYFGLSCLIQEELKSINKRQPAFYNNIIQVSGVLFHGWYTPSTPIFLGNLPPLHCHF